MEENLRCKALKLKDQQNVEYLIKLKLNNGFIFQHSKQKKETKSNNLVLPQPFTVFEKKLWFLHPCKVCNKLCELSIIKLN